MKEISVDTKDGSITNLRLKFSGNVSIYVIDPRRLTVSQRIKEFSNSELGSLWIDIIVDYLSGDDLES